MKLPGEAPAVSPLAVVTPSLPESLRTSPLLGPLDAAPGYLCSVCGESFPVDKVFDQEGAIICEGCRAGAAGLAVPPDDAGPGSFPAVPTLSTLMELPPADDLPPPPDTSPAADPAPDPADAASAAVDVDDTIAELGAISASALRTRRQPAPKKFPLPMLITAGVSALVLAGIITYRVTRYGGSPAVAPPVSESGSPPAASAGDQLMSDWEQRNAPRLSQWRSTARGMEVSGDLAGAQMLYQKMLTLSKSRGATVQNPGIVAMLAEAQARFDTITQKIGPPPAPLASAPPAVPGEDSSPASAESSPAPSGVPKEFHPAIAVTPESSVPAPPPAPSRTADDGANWEVTHRDQLLQLSAGAAALEQQKQPIAALAKLQLLLQLVGDRQPPLGDPQLKSTVAAADESRKRLLVFARDSDQVRAVTARSLLAAGLKAEQDKKWKTAVESLSDASQLIAPMLKPVQRYRDPMYLTSLDAAAVACMKLKQNQRANELFADDEPLGRAALAINSPSRDLVWNRAVNDLTQKLNIMRSVKMLRDFMDLHKEPDEPLLNLLGTVLFVADESNPANRKILDDGIGFYSQRSMDLEKTHPGQRRWGIEWLSEAEAQSKFDGYNKSLDAYQEALRAKTAADTHAKDLQDALRVRNGRTTPAEVNVAKAAVTTAAAAVKAAHDLIPRPPWLKDVEPIIPTFQATASVTLAGAPTSAPSPVSPAPASPGAAPTVPAAPASQPAVEIVVPAAPQARYAAAFPIDRTHFLTAADPLGSATTVKIQDTRGGVMTARVVAKAGRLALLEVSSTDAGGPLKFLTFATDFTGGPVQCAAIPQANLFGPTVTLLTADAAPPSRSAWWVNLSDHPRLPGSPLLNAQNEVIGVEVASRDDARQRIPAVTLDDLRKFLSANHVISVASGSKPDPNVVSQVTAESE